MQLSFRNIIVYAIINCVWILYMSWCRRKREGLVLIDGTELITWKPCMGVKKLLKKRALRQFGIQGCSGNAEGRIISNSPWSPPSYCAWEGLGYAQECRPELLKHLAVMCSLHRAECATCIKMRNNIKKGRAGHRPIIIVCFGSREQVDLVDMQSAEYEGMKWLLTYCDHGTKYAATCHVPNKQVIPTFCCTSFSFLRC